MNSEHNSSLSLESHSDFNVTERAHSAGKYAAVSRDCIKLPTDGGQCDWHSWHLGTVGSSHAAALGSAKGCVD